MKFIIATNNAKKLVELERILNPLGIEAVSAKEAGVVLDEVEETGKTFWENAFIKANAAFQKTGMPAVADDSGICVDALDGRPGIYSARYSPEDCFNDEQRTAKILPTAERLRLKKSARAKSDTALSVTAVSVTILSLFTAIRPLLSFPRRKRTR